MRKHERDILLMCDVAHKVMRNDTVHDLMDETYRADRNNFENNFKQKALGLTVLTAYNNKTYRVDDIDFTKTPLEQFDQRGTKVTLKDYYKTVSLTFFTTDVGCRMIFFRIFEIIQFRNTILPSETISNHC